MKVTHFDRQEDRLAFIKGEYKELIPKKAKKKRKKKDEVQAESTGKDSEKN